MLSTDHDEKDVEDGERDEQLVEGVLPHVLRGQDADRRQVGHEADLGANVVITFWTNVNACVVVVNSKVVSLAGDQKTCYIVKPAQKIG
jgi:hypothetical protein